MVWMRTSLPEGTAAASARPGVDAAAADGGDGGHELERELRRSRARAPPSGALPAASASASVSAAGLGREHERCGLKKQEDRTREGYFGPLY